MPIKKILLSLTAYLVFLIYANVSVAQTLTSTPSGMPKDLMRVTITQKKKDLQQRIQTIQDQNKQALILNIDDKIASVNAQQTGQMSGVLTRMAVILKSLISKTAVAKTNGEDVAAVELAITDANISLDTAQKAVASQSAKIYTLNPSGSNSATLKLSVGQVVSQLQADLRTVHALVIDVKQKIAIVIRELAKTGVGKIGQGNKEASSPPALFNLFFPKNKLK